MRRVVAIAGLLVAATVPLSPAASQTPQAAQTCAGTAAYGLAGQVCAEDRERGHEAACDGAGGFYRATTGAHARASAPVGSIGLEAGGTERCTSTQDATVGSSGTVCVRTVPGGGCYHQAYTSVTWGQDRIATSVSACALKPGFFCASGAGVHAAWGQGPHGGACTIEASTSLHAIGTAADPGTGTACPSDGPPGSPNPGWGELVETPTTLASTSLPAPE
jgi:hypothetical protein